MVFWKPDEWKETDKRHLLTTSRLTKLAANGNLRLCLKSKPQVKCHWSLPAGLTSEGERRAPSLGF